MTTTAAIAILATLAFMGNAIRRSIEMYLSYMDEGEIQQEIRLVRQRNRPEEHGLPHLLG